jgi:hypothetical protein
MRAALLSLVLLFSSFCSGKSPAAIPTPSPTHGHPVAFTPSPVTPIAAATPGPTRPLIDSAAILYMETPNGGMDAQCTATALDVDKGQTIFLTAAHCVTNDAGTEVLDKKFYLAKEARNAPKVFLPATIRIVGHQKYGDDFALLTAVTEAFAVLKVGNEAGHHECSEVQDAACRFVTIAAPKGLGLFSLPGTITSLFLDRRTGSSDYNWRGYMVVEVHGAPGASGSALVCECHRQVIGIMIGIYHGYVVALPASRIRNMEARRLLFVQ